MGERSALELGAYLCVFPPQSLHPKHWFPGMACHICGAPVRRGQAFNLDHVVPMAIGGRRGKANKDYAHVLCNSVKGHRHPFSLRTEADRQAAAAFVTPRTYRKLLCLWSGESV